MYKYIFPFIVIILWILILNLFRKQRMHFFKYLTGSVGFFFITMMFFLEKVEYVVNKIIIYMMRYIGNFTEYFSVYESNSIISFNSFDGVVSMSLNYECSGVIEMVVFTSLIIFFPFGSIRKRISFLFVGNILLVLANIIRLVFIILVVKFNGVDWFYITHTLYARILFFCIVTTLYYYVFTKTHIKAQKVGGI